MNDEHTVGGKLAQIWNAPNAFFAQFGILGVPFMFVYTFASIIIASVAVIGFIWGSVVALFFLLFQQVPSP